MGILNLTPNSFSDGNRFLEPAAAVAEARRMVGHGAAVLDLGPEASSFFRPGVVAVDAAEQLRRLLPVLEALRGEFAGGGPVLSVDTRLAAVAEAAIGGGADWVNDISAGTHDPAMLGAVARLGCPIVLMHIGPAFPANPERDDADIVGTVATYLAERVAAAVAAGVRREHIWIDPGIGFGKTPADNWRLVLGLERLGALGLPVVLGASRKRFLETEPPEEVADWGAAWARARAVGHLAEHPRDVASAVVSVLGAARGAALHRVHNVGLHGALGEPFCGA